MATLKRRRADPRTLNTAEEQTLPTDLLLEIVARSNVRTLLRCTAACRLLRRDILGTPFVRRVTQQDGVVPSCVIACLTVHDDEDDPRPHLSLVHPATPAALTFFDDHMAPRMAHSADGLFGNYCPITSRGGLVLLRRRQVNNKLSNLCVYDPVTGHRTFLSNPPGIATWQTQEFFHRCVLLTAAADGIGCSFSLFVPYNTTMQYSSNTRTIKVQTAMSTCGTWEPSVTSHTSCAFFSQHWKEMRHKAVVLQGGTIHWLLRCSNKIIFYNVYTMKHGTINLPGHINAFKGQLHLGSYYSHDGQKLLRLLLAHEFKISVWHQVPGRHWASEAVVIDIEEKLRSLDTSIPPGLPADIQCMSSGDASNAVLLLITTYSSETHTGRRTMHVILDLETKEILKQHYSTSSSVLLEVDLLSRLRSMKVFP